MDRSRSDGPFLFPLPAWPAKRAAQADNKKGRHSLRRPFSFPVSKLTLQKYTFFQTKKNFFDFFFSWWYTNYFFCIFAANLSKYKL